MDANSLWFTARGAGLSALIALSLAVGLGAIGSMRMRSAASRVIVQYLHRTAAVLGLALILVHVTTLVMDSKAHVGLAGAIIPFASHYRANSIALGSIAMYALLIVAALGAARGRVAGSPRAAKIWRALHALAYPAWTTALLHSILSGTDRSQGWVIVLDFICGAFVLFSVCLRVVDAGATRPSRVVSPAVGAR